MRHAHQCIAKVFTYHNHPEHPRPPGSKKLLFRQRRLTGIENRLFLFQLLAMLEHHTWSCLEVATRTDLGITRLRSDKTEPLLYWKLWPTGRSILPRRHVCVFCQGHDNRDQRACLPDGTKQATETNMVLYYLQEPILDPVNRNNPENINIYKKQQDTQAGTRMIYDILR